MPVEHQPPDVLAMIIAKAVHRDVATERYIIFEPHHVVGAEGFPFKQPPFVLYIPFRRATA